MPTPLGPDLGGLRRRLRIGLFLDIWPPWAIASLLLAGTIAVICRMFFARAAPFLPWLWLAPIVTAIPVLVTCWRRRYRPAQIVALADSLGGGQGLLLTLFETNNDAGWARSPLVERASTFALPRFELRRKVAALMSAAAFLAVGLLLPQRVDRTEASAVLAEQIAANLTAAVVELKQQALITPEEEQRLEEEIERVRRGAEDRVDAAAWEASDAVRERMVASLSEKQAAVNWAQESLARYAAAASADGAGSSSAEAQAAELSKALEKLAQNGLLAGAPAELRGLLKGGKLPTDPAALRNLSASLAKYLGDANQRFGQLAGLGQEFGRFDPAEFPLGTESGADGDGQPGRGGVNRGRADAALTFGKETAAFDRFKSQPLPPGAARSPDDWAPVVTLPGAPQEGPVQSGSSAARQYSSGSGQGAWRRSLAPRHQSAVKKYFDADPGKKGGGGERNRN
jgi:hypothetical protein